MSLDAIIAALTGNDTRTNVTGAIEHASQATGVNFQYLLATAKIESNMNTKASASTSSARGLYQFIEQTWLGTVKEAGAALGYGKYADAITRTSSGRYIVNDPNLRAQILQLRHDPAASAAMAGVLTQSNASKLTGSLGRRPTDGELYIAHFMGVGGAAKLINMAQSNPDASAASVFPNAAGANRPIFYTRTGRARSVSEVYGELTGRYNRAANTQAVREALAHASPSQTSGADTASFVTAFAPTPLAKTQGMTSPGSGTMPLNITPPSARVAATSATDPVFHSLFRAGDRRQAVSPAVERIWSEQRGSQTLANTQNPAPSQASDSASAPFDLFSDRQGRYAG